MSAPLRIDNSTLRAVAECSTQALLRYHHGLTSPDDRAELRCGTAIHAGFAAYFAGQGATAASKAFAESYRDWAHANLPAGDRLAWSNVSRIFDAWMDAHPLGALPFTVRHTEIGFAFPLDEHGDIVFCGRMDGIGELRDGGGVVIENKSTGNISPWWIARFRMDSQLSGYITGAAEHLKGERITGAIINAIELRKLPSDDTRKCKAHAVAYAECGHLHAKWQLIGPVERSEAQLREWRRTALQLARKWRELLDRYPDLDAIHAVRMQGTFNGACRSCVAQDWCSLGRPLDLLDSMMVVNHWKPYPMEEAKP